MRKFNNKYIIYCSFVIIFIVATFFTTKQLNAETIDHTHIWTNTYDKTNHWEYCTICKDTRNTQKHSLQLIGNGPTCDVYAILGKYVCSCGYEESVQRLEHIRPENTIWNDYLGTTHISYQCDRCGGGGSNSQSGNHVFQVDGKLMTATEMKNAGYDVHSYGTSLKCTICNLSPNLSKHIGYSCSCSICGKYFGLTIDYNIPQNTFKNGQLAVDLSDGDTHYVYFKAFTNGYEGSASSHRLNGDNYSVGSPELIDKNGNYWLYRIPIRLTNTDIPITGVVGIYSIWSTTNAQGSLVDGYELGWAIRAENNPLAITDLTAPTITKITQTDQKTSNNWATIKQINIKGNEKATGIVYITIKDKETGKAIVNRSSVAVTNSNYEYTCTPELEGDEEGRTYSVIVEDYFGNQISQDIIIEKTDSSAPEIQSNLIYSNWSGEKIITLNFADYGSKGVQLSFNNQTDYVELSGNNGIFTWTKTFSDEIIGTKDYNVYVKDGLGNATVYTLTVGNIDKTIPKVNTITQTYNNSNGHVSIAVNSDDFNGSGVKSYALSTSNTVPTTFTNVSSSTFNIDISKNGTYYLWVKDAVGLVSNVTTFNVTEVTNTVICKDYLTDKTTLIETQNSKTYINGTSAKGSDWGTESPYDNVQYTYSYSDCSSVTVDGNETVYRYWTRTVNKYNVTYIDVVDTPEGEVLGTKTEALDYGTIANAETLGTDTEVGKYYTDYRYVGSSNTEIVDEEGAVVYRFFELARLQVGPNITVEQWHGEYDGQPHGITISSSIPNLKVMYGLQPGVYNLTSCPEFTNTGEYTVYYQISKEGYTPIEGSQTVKIVNKGANMVDVYATQASTFTVRIPKVIILDGKEGHGAYSIKVSGNIAGTDIITVTPESEFFMKQDGKEDIKTTVTQTGTDFSYANGVTETGTQTETGKIEMESISAGKWSGLFNFNITSSVDTKAEDSIGSVEEDILNETVIGQDTAQDKESEFDTLENEVKTAE